MAELIREAMNSPDEDGDQVPDRLLQLFNDSGFSLNSDNWKNRRRVIFITVGTSWALSLAIACIAVVKLLAAEQDIPPNIMSLATQIFYAMMGFSTTLILGYCGLSTADSNSYRKHTAELAKAIPTPVSNNQRSTYDAGFDRSQNWRDAAYQPIDVPSPTYRFSAPIDGSRGYVEPSRDGLEAPEIIPPRSDVIL